MIETNSLIKASAGTGKTFALATRFIRLMMFDKVNAESIVALTFSRAAAHEIYTKILTRLSAAAKCEDGAAKEWKNLLEDYEKASLNEDGNGIPDAKARYEKIRELDIPHAAADFRRLLRRLVDAQHLGTIATIDSFILRIVQNFPKEMGFQNAVEVLDPIDASRAVEDAVRQALSTSDGKGGEIAECFRKTRGDEFSRTCLSQIFSVLNEGGWRRFVAEHPECREWTLAAMCAALGVSLESTCPDLTRVNIEGTDNPAEKFVLHASNYEGNKSLLASGKAGEMMLALWLDKRKTDFGWATKGGKVKHFEYGEEGAAAIRAAIVHMMNLHLKRQLEIVLAKIKLAGIVDDCYHQTTRRCGKLTFEDFTKYSAEGDLTDRGLGIKNVEFRFDARFSHWALDEFQDTSALQWKCLNEFVGNAANEGAIGEPRSVMIVGDFKQSIYTWRGASSEPFTETSSWPAFNGCTRDLKLSRRYGPHITAFVNKVFGSENIKVGEMIPEFCRAAVAEWNAGWVDHESHEPEDFLKVIGVESDADNDGADEILPVLYKEVRALWDRRQAAGSREEIGILVRNNDKGLVVAEYLRAKGLPVVWEGLNPVHDLPVVQAVLALLKLAEHPEDSVAWKTVNDLFGIREILLPECTSAVSVSSHVARLLARQGLARTLKDFCGTLREDPRLDPSKLTSERLGQLVEMGVAFESRRTGGVDEFARFLESAQKRELSVSSDMIRILTIHRSKGLGVDHLFVPLFEGRSKSVLFAGKNNAPLYAEGEGWVLPHLQKGCEMFNDETRRVFEKMRNGRLMESLRTYYVALTRAKKSMFVIFPDDPGKRKTGSESNLLMRDLITEAVGGVLPFESGTYPSFRKNDEDRGKVENDGKKGVRVPFAETGKRQLVERVSPSGAGHEAGAFLRGRSAAVLFDRDYGSGAAHGVEVHAEYERIEWADGDVLDKLPAAFRIAFVKPSADAEVWRERNYELFADGRWETGQFDRVVFTGVGDDRRAVIYDFKTNAKRPRESDEGFAARMCDSYAQQMASYRAALSALTGISPAKIKSVLLLVSTGAAQACEN